MTAGRLAAVSVPKAAEARGNSVSVAKRRTIEREADQLAEKALQTHSAPPPSSRAHAVSDTRGRFGSGRALDAAMQSYFEPRLGADLSKVRIHADAAAGKEAERLGASAFTEGFDIVFGSGEFAPESQRGRGLIAHELAHIAQRQKGTIDDSGTVYFKPKSVRFQDEPTLDEVSDGKRTLKFGDKGEAVIRIQVGLSELGDYAPSVIDENFDGATVMAVKKFQGRKGLTGKVTAGEVQKLTFDALDADFSASFKVERDVIGKQTAANPTAGTDALDAEERKAAARAISTEVKAGPGGALPKFKSSIPGSGKYEDRLHDLVEVIIKDQFERLGKGKATEHANAANLYDWTQIDVIAKAAQAEVDAVLKKFYGGVSHAVLAKGTNIFDAWDDKVAQLTAGGKAEEDKDAAWRVEKIITGDKRVMALDTEHGVIQSRAAEKAIIARVKAQLVAKYRAELLETHKGWPGFEDAGKIFIQRFKGATQDKRRFDMWRYFQTFIHEYIHALESTSHQTYRGGMSEKAGGKTLREGVTDYLTKIVWSGIKIDDPLRAKIEGPYHDPSTKFSIPPLNTYGEAENAERLAGVVGIRNVIAAFLMGKPEFIGKP
jgi:peptidoglycan hydrolase-like protein with peptidoglycan-binding domain